MFSSRLGQGVEALFPPERHHRYIFGFGIEEDKGVGVLVLANPSKRFPMKEEYCDSMIDLVFEDKTLTITGHVRLPGSVEFVKKVAGFA